MDQDLLNKWKEFAARDLESASILLKNNELLHSAFHLQQCAEKYLKFIIIKNTNQQPPYIHNLVRLASEAGIADKISPVHLDLLNFLNSYYIKARYPSYQKTVAEGLDATRVRQMLSSLSEFIEWLKHKQML
jgi:HEPN domain-containing protein